MSGLQQNSTFGQPVVAATSDIMASKIGEQKPWVRIDSRPDSRWRGDNDGAARMLIAVNEEWW